MNGEERKPSERCVRDHRGAVPIEGARRSCCAFPPALATAFESTALGANAAGDLLPDDAVELRLDGTLLGGL
jgi:hypothetical protein